MNEQWSKPLVIVLLLVGLLIPWVRRFVLYSLIRNKHIRNMGLRFIVASPYLRQKILHRFMPIR